MAHQQNLKSLAKNSLNCRLLQILANIIFMTYVSMGANSVAKIRLLLQEQSDLGPHCLSKSQLKHFSRRQKQTTFVVPGASMILLLLGSSTSYTRDSVYRGPGNTR